MGGYTCSNEVGMAFVEAINTYKTKKARGYSPKPQGGYMIVINNLMKHLQDYELEGLKLRNKKTKEFKVFSNKEELFYEVYNIYIIYKSNLK